MICLFGGTFDPVHLGHLHAARAVADALGVEPIRLVLSARPSHKGGTGASIEARWAMLELACADDPRLQPDDREIHRERPSFTVETLEAMRVEHPDESLVWVIGSDAYALLPSWYRWREVLELANLVVLRRPGTFPELNEEMRAYTSEHEVGSLVDCHNGGIFMLDDVMREVAAAEVRAGIAEGRNMAHLLPEPVALYIKKNRLYGG